MTPETKAALAAANKAKRAKTRLLKDVSLDELRIACDWAKEQVIHGMPLTPDESPRPELLHKTFVAYLSRASKEQLDALRECIPSIVADFQGYLGDRVLFNGFVLNKILGTFLRVTNHHKYIKHVKYRLDPETQWWRIKLMSKEERNAL